VTRQVSRSSQDAKSLVALEEIESAADDLVEQLARLSGSTRPRVALSYFSQRGRKSALGESIAQDLATLLLQKGRDRIEVYTRRKLHEAAREQHSQRSDLFDSRTAARLGKFAGVHFIVCGALQVRQGEGWQIRCRIINVETAEEVGGVRFTIPDDQASVDVFSLDNAVQEMARQLLSNRCCGDEPLKVAAYAVTSNRKNFPFGTETLQDVASELQMTGGGEVRFFTRQNIEAILEELALQHSDPFDETTQARIGKFVCADSVLTGFGEIYRSFYKFNLIIVDVETSRLLSGAVLCIRRP